MDSPTVSVLGAFAALTLAFSVYRLTSLNTFVDHRKTTLRSIFREVCEAYPDLLLLIQNIGKTAAPEREIAILERVHPSVGLLANEIHGIRKQYKTLHLWVVVIILDLDSVGAHYSCA